METNKAKFRKKAESISQMPSSSVWDKLEEKLDQAPPKKKSLRLFPLLAIAASFLLLFGLLFTSDFFSGSAEKATAQVANFAEANLEQHNMQIAMVSGHAGRYQSFYEKVAQARKDGILKMYGH